MNIQERMEAFWAGEKPDRIPYMIYMGEWRQAKEDPVWDTLFQNGLGIIDSANAYKTTQRDLEEKTERWEEGGKSWTRTFLRTSVGTLTATAMDGWRQKYCIETAEDYRVMKHIVEQQELSPDYAAFAARGRELKRGVLWTSLGRTPMQSMLVDYVGLENFGMHLFELEEPMMELYEALHKHFLRRVELVAGGPGRYAALWENFTAHTLGPGRFERFHLPRYAEACRELHAAGKIVGAHFDGMLKSCKGLIAGTDLDLIESLTPPPEGDMSLAECRAAWPRKLFGSNINISCYELPREELKALIQSRIKEAAPDGRRLCFQVSEYLPRNYRESMPAVQEAINEVSGK